MIIEDAIAFLRHVPPFQFLDEPAVAKIAKGLAMEFFPKGTTILKQGGPPSKSLFVIKKGGVKVFRRSPDGQEAIVDFRGEGDLFGYLSIVGADKARANVLAVDDTSCYTIKRETVRRLFDSNETVRDFFLKSFLNIYIDKTFQEMQSKGLYFSGGGERILFSNLVGEVVTKPVLTAPQDISIREAAGIMCENKISSLVLVDNDNRPLGILTDRDLRGKVVARGRDVNEPVKNIMSYPIMRIDAKDYCFEALLRMIKYNVHHLLVVKDGALSGIVTNHDFLLLQGTSPLLLAKDIDSQRDIEGLSPVSKQINNVVGILIKQGARASDITKIITEINDRLVRKVLEIAEKKFGTPPAQYCWIALGSEGRREQTCRRGQDNAIIYSDPATTHEADAAKKYFLSFANFVRDSLVQCGFPSRPSGNMASNPQWCRPLEIWKKYFSTWLSAPVADELQNCLTFFDFRPVAGEYALAEQLRDSLCSMLRGQKSFLQQTAHLAAATRPPVGILKAFVVEKSGERKDKLDLKAMGLTPIINIVRLFALEEALKETSTLERIDALKDRHGDIKEFGEEMTLAFEFIMLLDIQHQFERISNSQPPDDVINPGNLTSLQKKMIKEAFNLISRLQDSIVDRYGPMKWYWHDR